MATGTRFAANNANAVDQTFGSEGLALGQVEDLANQANMTSDNAVSAGGSFTATAAQLVNGLFEISGTQGAMNLTTPTAAAIVATLPNVQPGSSFDVDIVNTNNATVTVVAGTGVTLAGTTACPTNTSQHYKGVVTNATAGSEAVRLVGLLHTPS